MRFIAAFLLSVVLTTPAFAQSDARTNTPLMPLYQCASIQTDNERLACFDGAVATLRTDADQGRIVAIDRAQADSVRNESFGFRLPAMARLFSSDPNAIQRVEAQVVRIYGSGRVAYELANGQVWRQVETGRTNIRVNDNVVVERGVFGSYMISSATRGGAGARVHREE